MRVLDPACGSGNFLYVTLEHLKRLEGEVQAEIAEKLAERGITVTQATISRDVTELRLVRVPAGKGQHRYRSNGL